MSDAIGEPLCLVGSSFWAPTTAQDRPPADLLEPRARGRASLLTLMFAQVLAQAAAAAGFERGAFSTVFGSAFGEMERLISLLQGMQGTPSEVSPLRFQTSVHNASAGQISIATANQHFSTSVAAGRSTVAMGLIETASLVASTQENVILVLGDEGPPPRLHDGALYPPLAAAFAFVPLSRAPKDAVRLQLCRQNQSVGAGVWPDALSQNPCAQLLALTSWLNDGATGTFSLNDAGPTSYCIGRS